MNICFITAECIGPFKNGGIGTSTTGLAEALAGAGYGVTLLYTRGIHLTGRKAKYWQQFYKKSGIDFVALRYSDFAAYAGPLSSIGYTIPCAVLDYLRLHEFDIVHFNDTDAEGFLALAAHRYTGLLPDARFVLAMHSPREWVYEHNLATSLVPVDTVMHFTERLSTPLADLVWSPSRYLLDWLTANNWQLPDKVIRQQYVMPSQNFMHNIGLSEKPVDTGSQVQKLVFFGRLEQRKGLRLFLDAVEKLHGELEKRKIELVFLGRSATINGETSRSFISRYTKKWNVAWRVISGYGQSEAIDFLSEGGCLAVIASVTDNSPCTVYEAIEAKIPFITAATGGIPELLHQEDIADTLFAYDADSLKDLILRKLDGGITNVRPRTSREENIAGWLSLHRDLQQQPVAVPLQNTVSADEPGLIIVVIEDGNSEEALTETIGSVLSSDLPPDRIIVISRWARDVNRYAADIRVTDPGEFEPHFAEILKDLAHFTVFFIYSGVRVKTTALGELARCTAVYQIDGLMPSVTTASGLRADSPGGAIAPVFHYGPVATGLTVLGADAVRRAMTMEPDINAGPFCGLPDRAVVSGSRIHSYPEALIDTSTEPLPSVQMTVNRMELYSQTGSAGLKMLVMLAGSFSGKGMLASLSRYWGYRLLRSRFGFMFPLISGIRDLCRRGQ